MAVTITHDMEKCIGCGACAAVCPDNWVMEGDKSKPKKTRLENEGCDRQAADACPVQCIKVTKD